MHSQVAGHGLTIEGTPAGTVKNTIERNFVGRKISEASLQHAQTSPRSI